MAHILLLEPNRLLAGQYRRFLEDHGDEVAWAQSAQDAINAADQSSPEVIVMELLLAGHSGMEFIHEFRSYAEWRQVPIIILTRLNRADVSADDKVLKDLGVISYLYKPEASLQRLNQLLNKALAERSI